MERRTRWSRFSSITCLAGLTGIVACGGTDGPTPVAPPPLSPPTAVASAAAAPADAKPAESGPTIDQLLKVHRAVGPHPIGPDTFVFRSDAPGTPQIFRARRGDKPEQLTDFPDRVSAVRPSRDGKFLLFLKDSGGDENDQIFRLDLATKASAAFTAAPKIKHTLPALDPKGARIAFTSNARNGKDMDVYVEPSTPPADAASPRKPLVELSGSHSVADWTPAGGKDGTLLVVEARSNVDQNLWVIDVATKKKRLLTPRAPAAAEERYDAARFTRDGKSVLTLSDAGRDFLAVVSIDVATSKRTPVVEETHDVQNLAVADAADTIAYAVNVDGVEEVRLAQLDAKRKVTKTTPSTLKGVAGSLDLADDGSYALVDLESATQPTEIYRVDGGSGAEERLTTSDHAGVDPATLVKEELVVTTASDGVKVPYFWYERPRPGGEKGPAVIMVHGGPESQAQPVFNPVVQYLATHGYGVAAPNVRGSLGYGKAYAHLDDKAKREDSVRDLSELGKHVAARPSVHPRRVALYGGSYGGYMVLAGLTLYPDQWAAGIDIVGIANFRTFLEQTAPYRRAQREAEYGSLSEDAALLDRISPLNRVDKVQAPLFVIHGTHDPRVPIGEARQISDALKKRGVAVDLMVFDDEGHGLSKRKNRLVAYPAVVTFLDKHVKNRN